MTDLYKVINADFAQWLDDVRRYAVEAGYLGDIVADVGVDEWAGYYCEGEGYTAIDALHEYFIDVAAIVDADMDLCCCEHIWDAEEHAACRCKVCGKPEAF